VVGAVKEELLYQFSPPGDETGAQAGHVGALGKAVEDEQAVEIAVEHVGGGQGAKGRIVLVEVDFGVALIGGDDEVVPFGKVEECLPFVEAEDLAAGVAGRADVDHLHGFPEILRHLVEVHGVTIVGRGVEEVGPGAGEEGGAFVDLVEGVGRYNALDVPGGVDDRLGEGEEGLAAAVDRQDLAGRVELDAIAARAPGGDGTTQGVASLGCGIIRQPVEMGGQRLADEIRGRVLGLADGQIDRRQSGIGRHPRKQLPQLLEGVGVQLVEAGIHVIILI